MSAVSNTKTVMTWQKAEEYLSNNPDSLRNVQYAIDQSRGHGIKNVYYENILRSPILGISICLVLLLALMVLELRAPGPFVWNNIEEIIFGLSAIGIVTFVGAIISLVAGLCYNRRISKQMRQRIEADKKNPEHPFLAKLLKKDLAAERTSLEGIRAERERIKAQEEQRNKSYEEIMKASAARIAMVEQALKLKGQ